MNEPALAIDIGNSRVKWGWRAHARWHAVEACSHAEFAARFRQPVGVEPASDRGVWSSVASDETTHALIDVVATQASALALTRFTIAPRAGGLDNRYRSATLGPDRLAAAIGARVHVSAGALVVASFGTATTVDTVSHDHVYLGGVILPGVDAMLDALAGSTAHLPRVAADVAVPDLAFPDRTETAMLEGVVRAQVGAFALTWRTALARYGAASVVLTGGGAARLVPRLRAALAGAPCVVADNLVLDGLVRACAPSR